MEGALHIQLCSRRVQIRIPEHIRRIAIDRPWLDEVTEEPLLCKDGNGWSQTMHSGRFSDSIGVVPDAKISVNAVPNVQIDYRSVRPAGMRTWAVVRRVLTEGRDRLQPLVGI